MLAYGIPARLLPALAARSRLVIARHDPSLLQGLPAGGFSLVVVGAGAVRDGLLHVERLRSPASLVAFYGAVIWKLERDGQDVPAYKRIGELELYR